ncbi:MAG TPA: Ig-like domain-containing protein [Burkholderiaceae bacterium]|nr:Ig-like domain-containing protein [Burkholderiaceae bacterium]
MLSQLVTSTSLYARAIPLHWYPDTFGGGPNAPVASDMLFEQTVTVEAAAPLALKVHFKLTHNGVDAHFNATQELPAVYVNSAYTTLAYYTGSDPWNNAPLTETLAPVNGGVPDSVQVYAPEQWAARVDSNGQGLSVFAPGQYPGVTATSYPGAGGAGPLGDATVYMRPMAWLTVAPGAVIESDVYLAPGDVRAARAAIYALHASLPPTDFATSIATVDTPTANSVVAGTNVSVAGWAFDNLAVETVNVYVDGVLSGTASLGGARPDVAAAYPDLAPVNCGWSYSLDSTRLVNGSHSLAIRVRDTSDNEAWLVPIPIVVSN